MAKASMQGEDESMGTMPEMMPQNNMAPSHSMSKEEPSSLPHMPTPTMPETLSPSIPSSLEGVSSSPEETGIGPGPLREEMQSPSSSGMVVSSNLTPERINLLALLFANLAYYPHTVNSEIINQAIAKRTYWQYWGGEKPDIDMSKIITAGIVGGGTDEGRKNLELLKDFTVEVVPQKNFGSKKTSDIRSTPPQFITDYLGTDYTDLSKWKIKFIEGENGINYIIKSTEWTISAVVAYHPEKNILVVGIRGTDSSKVSDLITDIAPTGRAVKSAHPLMAAVPSDARVPRGFLGYFESMGDEILKAIDEFVPDEKESTTQIIIAGHSLGGAAANVTSAFVASLSELYGVREKLKSLHIIDNPQEIPSFALENIHLRTFGMPANVGNQNYIDWLESQIGSIIHFSNPRDPVSHLTVAGKYLSDKRITGRYSQGTSKKWFNLESVSGDSMLKNPLDPHSLTRYAQAIIEQNPVYNKLRAEVGKTLSGGGRF